MSSKEEIQNIFGKVVLELRTEREMTQEQLAEHLGVSPHTITRIETGKTFVSSEVISQMCNLFQVAPSVLFTPRPHILHKEYINYKNEIIKLLPALKTDRLRELFNFLTVMNK